MKSDFVDFAPVLRCLVTLPCYVRSRALSTRRQHKKAA